MDPVQSTAGKVILDTVPDAAEQKSESGRLGGRILRACRPMCCSVQTDEGTEPDKKPLEKSTSQPPKIGAPMVSVSDTSAIASQNKQTSGTDPAPDTPASTDADTSPPANAQRGGHRTGSVDSGAGSFAGGPGS